MTDTNNISITPGTGAVTFNSGVTSNLGLTSDQVNSILADIIITNTGDGGDLYSGKTGNNIFNFRTITAGSGIQINQTDDSIEIFATGIPEAGSTLAKVATTGSYTDLINLPTVVSSLNQLKDTNISSPSTGQILSYNNGSWINEELSLTGLLTGVTSVGTGIDIWDTTNLTSVIPLRTFAAGSGINITLQDNTLIISTDESNINTWISGAGVPIPTLGTNGDFYIDITTGNVYEKSSSGWSLVLNILGPQGPQGLQGPQGQRGSTWSSGSTVPSSAANIGDMYMNTSTGYVYQYSTTGWRSIINLTGPQGAQGIQGLPGTNGSAGQRGSSWTSGTSNPTSTTALVNDMYLNTTSGYIFQYTASGWNQIAYTVGPQGASGTNGAAGQRGSSWSTGTVAPTSTTALTGDMYLNTSNGQVYQYTSTGWTNTNLNLVGPTGPQGPQGIQGTQGTQGPAGQSLVNKGTWVSGTTYTTNNYCFAPSSTNSANNSMYVFNGSSSIVSTITPGSDKTNWVEISGVQGQRGSTWTTGSGTPTSTTASSGDMYLNTANGEVYQFDGTKWNDTSFSTVGPQGSIGQSGPRGTSMTVGEGVPTSTTALIGDSYLNTSNGYVYEYTSSGWSNTDYSTKGTAGSNGTMWNTGTTNPSGAGNTGDFYLNNKTGDIYQYNGVSWIHIDNITGPIGPQGPQGIQGQQGLPGTGLTNKGTWSTGATYSSGDYVFDAKSSTDTTSTMWVFYGSSAITSTTHPYADTANWAEFDAPAGQRGSLWSAGSGVPSSTANVSDLYLNTLNGAIYQYQSTGWVLITTIVGATGPAGSTGQRGSLWTTGIGDTPPSNAVTYDQYLDTSSGNVYQYNGASWGVQGNIKGSDGANGSKWLNGTVDPTSSTTGMSIGDYYLNVTSGDIFQYITNGSVNSWSKIGNIQGPSGSLTTPFATYDSTSSTLTFTCSSIIMGDSLPTTDPNNAGQLWNNNGVVCISLGS